MNKQQGYVPIDLDGKALRLRFDSNALADAEELIGRSTVQLLSEPERIGFSELRALVFCGLPPTLRAKHGFRTHRDVGALVSFGNMADVARAVIEAIRLALPEEMQADAEADAEADADGETEEDSVPAETSGPDPLA